MRCLMQRITPHEGIEFKPTVNEYGYKLGKDKRRVFGKLGKKDWFALIQQDRDQCDYTLIMQMLCPNVTQFEDFEKTLEFIEDLRVSSLGDVMEYSRILDDQFNTLPLEVKQKYANDSSLFARAVVDGSFVDYVNAQYHSEQVVESVANGGNASDFGVESGTPASGTPASGTPASGTPASGTPASGTSVV